MPPPSPTVASWELGLRLRQRRAQLGVEVKTITDQLGFTRNYWSAVEHERKILATDKLHHVLDLLKYDDDERTELIELREAAKQRGWWSDYSALFNDELLRLFGLEHGAQSIRTYESLLIPGLLQTPDYARALVTASISVRPVEVDQRVAARLRRQERLSGDDPLQLTAVISEAALLQQVGGPQVLREQLRHLAAVVADHPDTIELRVIPFTAPARNVFGASTFHLIDFADARLPTLAWQETATVMGVLDKDTQVRELHFTYAEALQVSLSPADSLQLVSESIRKEA
ncbi:MAG: Scr1 family TA system antitoxin-like transcriptional regulator [Pseudonocardia sp.]